MIKIVLLVVGVLIGLVAIVWVAGAFLPREHVATRSSRFAVAPDLLFALITDAPSFPSWRSGVSKVEELPPVDGKAQWREHTKDGTVDYELSEMRLPSRVVTTIVSRDLPYGGRWVYLLEPEGSGTRLRITEEGYVNPPPFRFLARYVFGFNSTIEAYLRDVGEKLGQSVQIEP